MHFNLANDVAELTKGFSRAEYQAQYNDFDVFFF